MPMMLANRCGHMVDVSSMSAYLIGPGQVTYAASKSFIKSFSESLQMELHGTGVDVQSLCPGMTHTGFHDTQDFTGFDRAQMPKGLWMDSDRVVSVSLQPLPEAVARSAYRASVTSCSQACLGSVRFARWPGESCIRNQTPRRVRASQLSGPTKVSPLRAQPTCRLSSQPAALNS